MSTNGYPNASVAEDFAHKVREKVEAVSGKIHHASASIERVSRIHDDTLVMITGEINEMSNQKGNE